MTNAQLELVAGLMEKAPVIQLTGADSFDVDRLWTGDYPMITDDNDIFPCDMLVLLNDKLWEELESKHLDINRFIVCKKLEQVSPFLVNNKEWSVIIDVFDMYVLGKLDEDKRPLPSKFRMATNYAKTKFKELINGRQLVSLQIADERAKTCSTCVVRNDDRCTHCGCYLTVIPEDEIIDAGEPGKIFRADQECPLGKWRKHE